MSVSILTINLVRKEIPVEAELRKSYYSILPNIDKLANLNLNKKECLSGLLYSILLDFNSISWNSFLHFYKFYSPEKPLLKLAQHFADLSSTSKSNLLNSLYELGKLNFKIDKIVIYLVRYFDENDVFSFLLNVRLHLSDQKVVAVLLFNLIKKRHSLQINENDRAQLNSWISNLENDPQILKYLGRELYSLTNIFSTNHLKEFTFEEQRKSIDPIFYSLQMPIFLEDKIKFLLFRVQLNGGTMHLQWLVTQFNKLSLDLLKCAIRYICCYIHPPNDILASPVIQRYIFFTELHDNLISSQQRHVLNDSIIYDLFFYKSGEIMNIEPVALMLFPGDLAKIEIANELWKTLNSAIAKLTLNQAGSLNALKLALTEVLQLQVISQSRLERSLTLMKKKWGVLYKNIINNNIKITNQIDLEEDDLYETKSEKATPLNSLQNDENSSKARVFMNAMNKIVSSESKLNQETKELHLFDMFKKFILSVDESTIKSCFDDINFNLKSFKKPPHIFYKAFLEEEIKNPQLEIIFNSFSFASADYCLYRIANLNVADFISRTPIALILKSLHYLLDEKPLNMFNDFLLALIVNGAKIRWNLIEQFVNPLLNCKIRNYVYCENLPLFTSEFNISFLKNDSASKYMICDLVFAEIKLLRAFNYLIKCVKFWLECTGSFI
eukprot:NODE_84_length_22354_cov_0.646506.p3 type:complete len:668 gc:universal NODE_84_length_22354_cov_0.646506:1930-3933(+)